MSKYLIHYFSGTGNTYHMVKTMERELCSKGNEVDLLNIEKCKDIKLDNYDLHIFCFPVYGFGTPSIMLRHISSLKAETAASAAIVCTSAGTSGQPLYHCKYLLNKMGFKVFLTEMVVYTYNWTQFLNPKSKEVEQRVFIAAEANGIEITKKIMNRETCIKHINILLVILSWPIFAIFHHFARRVLGKTFIADESCIGCGKCKDSCPVKAIDMHNGKPTWKSNCECCQRCINICPRASIQLSITKLVIFVAFEIIPFYIIKDINNNLYDLPAMANIALYCAMFLAGTVLADVLISRMEKIGLFKKILNISYTKKYRRNIAKGFNMK